MRTRTAPPAAFHPGRVCMIRVRERQIPQYGPRGGSPFPVPIYAVQEVFIDPARGWTEPGRGRTVAGDRVLCSRSTRTGSGSDHRAQGRKHRTVALDLEVDWSRRRVDGRKWAVPLLHVIPADAGKPPAGTVPLFAFRQQAGPELYTSPIENPRAGFQRSDETKLAWSGETRAV